jgi:hypothetical protein
MRIYERMNNKARLRFGRCGGLSSFYTLLILLGVWALAIESKAEVSKPYVGRWERIMDSGNRETVEFTSDGRFSYDSYAGVLRGTYVEESPGILRIKAKGERLLFGATSGDARAEYEMEGSCLIVTTENGKSDKYFPANRMPRSAIIWTRSRELSLKARYHLTHRMMISWSKCRPLKRSCAEVGSVIPGVTAVRRSFQVCTRTVPIVTRHGNEVKLTYGPELAEF